MRNIAIGLAIVPFLASAALAAGDPDAGRALAKQWCSSCHRTEPGGVSSDIPPSFAALAARNKKDPNWIRAWLANPHPPMKGIDLSGRQIDDIIAYLQSLQP